MALTSLRFLIAVLLALMAVAMTTALWGARRGTERPASEVARAGSASAPSEARLPGRERLDALVRSEPFRDRFLARCMQSRSRYSCECLLDNMGPRYEAARLSPATMAVSRAGGEPVASDVTVCR